MKKYILILIVILPFMAKAQLLPVLGEQRAGISAVQFLKIGVGARSVALGESFIAIADDASALYWNPAGLTQFNDDQFIFTHNEWVVDMSHDFAGFVYHPSPVDAIGLSVTSVTTEDMPVTTEFAPKGTGEYFSYSDLAVSLSYARALTDKFSFGASIKYVEETLDKLKMRGVLIDLGTMYWTGLGSSRFAVSFTNFGNQLSPDGEVLLVGNRKQSEWETFSPPTIFRLGFAFEPYETEFHKVTTSMQINHPNDNSENLALGVEYTYTEPVVGANVVMRGGYKFNVDEQTFSFGAGLKVPVTFADFSFDYAYSQFERLGSYHHFSLMFGIK